MSNAVKFENYPHPPVQEAILDILVTVPTGLDLLALAEFGNQISDQYPNRRPRHSLVGQMKFNVEDVTQNAASAVAKQAGYIYRTNGNERAVQGRLDGFTYNRLPTYEGWDSFIGEAKSLWSIYSKIIKPLAITSISLRYINRILAPLPIKDFRDYCVLFPALPTAMPSALNQFFMSFNGVAKNAPGATSTINVTFLPAIENGMLPLIVDVSVAKPIRGEISDADLWIAFSSLREEKNLLFESSITEQARNLFRI